MTNTNETYKDENNDPKESADYPAKESIYVAGIGDEGVGGVLPPVVLDDE